MQEKLEKELFELVHGGFSYLINLNNYNSNWKKLLGFRNMQEKLEKDYTRHDFGSQVLQ